MRKFVSFRSPVAFLCLALGMAGCASNNVSLESRLINVDETAEPAGAVPQEVTRSLVSTTGPSYVTLTVSAVTDRTQNMNNGNNKRAVTSGSGYVVADNGYIMTAAHVAVANGNIVSARAADGRIYSGQVVAIQPNNDMALIKLRGLQGRAVTPVSDSCVSVGNSVFSLGKPHAQGDTARFGVMQSKSFGRAVQYGKFGYPDAMVLHMNTQKGESGGPLFDKNGQLAGMIVSTLSDGNGRSLTMAHAIPSTTLAKFLCSKISCGQAWTNIASSAPASCART